MALAGVGLVSAVVLFMVLQSFAQIQSDTVKVGGAAAGFLLVFYVFKTVYFEGLSKDAEREKDGLSRKIEELQEEVAKWASRFFGENFVVPEEYKPEISRDYNFAMGYPKDWEFLRLPLIIRYAVVKDEKSANLGIPRNVWVTIIGLPKGVHVKKAFKTDVDYLMGTIRDPKLLSEEESLFLGLPSMRVRISYSEADKKLISYNIYVANRERTLAYLLSFATLEENFEKSKELFDSIASTLRIG